MDSNKQNEDLLNPELLRYRFISASIYIAAFELLERTMIERVMEAYGAFVDEPLDIHNPRIRSQEDYAQKNPKYRDEVLSRNYSPKHASMDWLREEGAISHADIAAFDRIKTCRNHLAHRLLYFLGKEGMPPDFEKCFKEMVDLLRKIEVWWIARVEIPCNPDFDHQEIDVEDILPGRVMVLQLLRDIALGSEDRSGRYLEEFKKRSQGEND